MTATSLLLTIFFDETKADGWSVLRELITDSRDCVITIYAQGNKETLSSRQFGAVDRFNIAESVMQHDSGELWVRYRPAVASPRWSRIAPASNINVGDKANHELFQLFLTLSKLSRPGVSTASRTRGVVELLYRDITSSGGLEYAISSTLRSLCSELLRSGTWGFADPVPFRGLSLNEEWAVALTSALWIDPPTAAEGNHQYSFLCKGDDNGADKTVEVSRVSV